MRGIGFDHGQVPTKLLESLPKLKNIDISDNHLSCVRNVFKGLTIKKLSYSGNPELEEKTGRELCLYLLASLIGHIGA